MARIELGDGDYVVVYNEMIHKTTRALNQLLRKSLGETGYQSLDEQLRNAVNEQDKRDILRKVPIEGEDEIILLNQVTEWSFGAVSQESLDNIPSVKYQRLTQEVDKLYSSIPLAVKS